MSKKSLLVSSIILAIVTIVAAIILTWDDPINPGDNAFAVTMFWIIVVPVVVSTTLIGVYAGSKNNDKINKKQK